MSQRFALVAVVAAFFIVPANHAQPTVVARGESNAVARGRTGAGVGAPPLSTECPAWAGRAEAIRVARNINSLENRAHLQAGRYAPLPQLEVLTPEGLQVQLSTDGATYTFSIKDAADSCHRAAFSDQAGVIYTAEPLR